MVTQEQIFNGFPPYCRLYRNDDEDDEKDYDDEGDIVPKILVGFTGCRWPSWMLRLLRRRLKIFVCGLPRLNICGQ